MVWMVQEYALSSKICIQILMLFLLICLEGVQIFQCGCKTSADTRSMGLGPNKTPPFALIHNTHPVPTHTRLYAWKCSSCSRLQGVSRPSAASCGPLSNVSTSNKENPVSTTRKFPRAGWTYTTFGYYWRFLIPNSCILLLLNYLLKKAHFTY